MIKGREDMSLFKSAEMLLRETVHEWIEDGGSSIAAALAYYAVFSLSPLLIIVSLTLGLVMDPNTLESSLVTNLRATLGQQAADLIRSLLQNQSRTTDVVGTIVWLAIVVWGASGMFAQLQNALNKIWDVKARPGRSPLVLVRNRFQSFGIVILASAALLGTMVINTGLNSAIDAGRAAITDAADVESAVRTLAMFATPVPLSNGSLILLRVAQVVFTVLITTGLIAVVYRILPDVDISWRDVIFGSIFTALLLFIGQFAVGLYLSHANIGSVFGAAGSLTVILVWIYYSAQILLFGAEFTQIWARHYGFVIRPDSDAVWENETEEEEKVLEAGRDWEAIEEAEEAEHAERPKKKPTAPQ